MSLYVDNDNCLMVKYTASYMNKNFCKVLMFENFENLKNLHGPCFGRIKTILVMLTVHIKYADLVLS